MANIQPKTIQQKTNMKTRYCSNCGLPIEGNKYIKVLDNYLQVKYFETDELNCFCSEECLLDYISADTVYIDDQDESQEEEDETS